MNTLIGLLALLIAAVGGYYFTRLVLHLAQKKFQKEQSDKRAAKRKQDASAQQDPSAQHRGSARQSVSARQGRQAERATPAPPDNARSNSTQPHAVNLLQEDLQTDTSQNDSSLAADDLPGSHQPEHGRPAVNNSEATDPAVAADSGPDSIEAKSALRGGMWIGILERMLIAGFILAGQFAGVAVVVAIKGLGRYPELNAQTSERFIIGTLASLLWACACGWGGLWVIVHLL